MLGRTDLITAIMGSIDLYGTAHHYFCVHFHTLWALLERTCIRQCPLGITKGKQLLQACNHCRNNANDSFGKGSVALGRAEAHVIKYVKGGAIQLIELYGQNITHYFFELGSNFKKALHLKLYTFACRALMSIWRDKMKSDGQTHRKGKYCNPRANPQNSVTLIGELWFNRHICLMQVNEPLGRLCRMSS